VTQRTREIGVRLALGAAPARLMRQVIGRGIAHTAAGVVIGTAAAWQLATVVQSFLFEVRPTDPVVYGASALLLAVCGATATFIPARRAARVDPVIALRAD
jgi:ABC-type antimicrobial peptide transport system permease subunit